MSYGTNAVLHTRPRPGAGQTFHFQRNIDQPRAKKAGKKLALRFKHILLLFLLAVGIFYAGMKVYLHLISTEVLRIKTVEIQSRQSRVTSELRQLVRQRGLGNILLFDMAPLKSLLETHRWVKDAQIRKVFPSALRIEIKEREPAAWLERQDGWALIDEEGVVLEPLPDRGQEPLPVLRGIRTYASDYRDKLRLAWDCLAALTDEMKAEIDCLDFSEPGCACLFLKGTATKIILGRDYFQEKMRLYREKRGLTETESGPAEYVDLRFFEDRIIFKPAPQPEPEQAGASRQTKEVE